MRLKSLFVLLFGLLHIGPILAQGYPDRPIRLVVPSAPAGVVDIIGRLLAAKLGPQLNGTVVIENKTGAAGVVGTDAVAKAAPDGYTLSLMTGSTYVFAPLLFKNIPYQALRDFVPITQVTAAPTLLVVKPSLPVKTVPELVALAKQKPGELNYASNGRGGALHLAAELFQRVSGTQMNHVVYRGSGPALIDLRSSSVNLEVFFDSIPSVLPYAQDGRLRAVAVTSLRRSTAAPEIPTIAETYPGFDLTVWQGLAAPAGTPMPIVETIYRAVAKVMADPEVRAKLRSLGSEAMATSPAEVAAYIHSETQKWSQLFKEMNIQPE
jgi:tripartite-type tricarboxylate transporter receptor subunit TctC